MNILLCYEGCLFYMLAVKFKDTWDLMVFSPRIAYKDRYLYFGHFFSILYIAELELLYTFCCCSVVWQVGF